MSTESIFLTHPNSACARCGRLYSEHGEEDLRCPQLSTCQLPDCGKAFMVSQGKRGGAPRRKYCCREHMLEHHNRGATERVQKSRLQKRLDAARKLLAEHAQ